jgi:hypothetical protein
VPDAEAKAYEAKALALMAKRTEALGQYDSEWHDETHLARIDGQLRTAWIVSPADGLVPYTAEGRARLAKARAGSNDGPETRTPSDRCLGPSWGAAGPPMLNAPYAPDYVIVQTADHVAIESEMNHEVRIVRLNATHPSPLTPQWDGDSIGHWEKDTLVVETTGFYPPGTYRSPVLLIGPDTKVIERFTRVAPDEIRYEFSVEDPKLYTAVWRGEMALKATKDTVFEFACHEGNYSMRGILAGARREEAVARAAAKR